MIFELVRDRIKLVEMDQKFLNRAVNEGFRRGKEA